MFVSGALARIGRLAAVLCLTCGTALAGEVSVFAAASLKTSLDAVAAQFHTTTGHRVTLTYAGSSQLARQIQHGAPADIFVSANPQWMDVLEAAGAVVVNSRRDLLTNRLVLVGSEMGSLDFDTYDFVTALGDGRLAVALTSAVPAGIYAKAVLTQMGLWPALENRLAETDNVRAALALVALRATPLGIVYATDALAEPRVSVWAEFPTNSHPPIVYPAALISEHPVAKAFFDFLAADEAGEIFQSHGFGLAGQS